MVLAPSVAVVEMLDLLGDIVRNSSITPVDGCATAGVRLQGRAHREDSPRLGGEALDQQGSPHRHSEQEPRATPSGGVRCSGFQRGTTGAGREGSLTSSGRGVSQLRIGQPLGDR